MVTKKVEYFSEPEVKQEEETVIMTKGQYDEYQKILGKLQDEETKSKTWQEKYMEQVSINKKLQEEGQERSKYEQLLKEAQEVYDDKRKLEIGILNLIKAIK